MDNEGLASSLVETDQAEQETPPEQSGEIPVLQQILETVKDVQAKLDALIATSQEPDVPAQAVPAGPPIGAPAQGTPVG